MTDSAVPPRPLAAPAPTAFGGRVELRVAAPSSPSSIAERPAAEPTASGDGPPPLVLYEARWFVGDEPSPLLGQALVAKDGSIHLSAPAELPAWLQEFTEALLKTVVRSAPISGFPRRLTRWRRSQGASA